MTRRDFLRRAVGGGAALALFPAGAACGLDPGGGGPGAGVDGGTLDGALFDGARPAAAGDLLATPSCEESEAQIEGPFYRPNAPLRDELATADDGELLVVDGIVRGMSAGPTGGASCAPLAGALVDVWQADADAVYDNTSPDFRLRGRLAAGVSGRYRFQTILPGRYLNGGTYRPRHLHFKVSGAGHRLLTTQLYFEGDPFNATDPFLHPSLVLPLRKEAGVWRVTFDVVLARA